MTENYYSSRRGQLLREFDDLAGRVRRVFVPRLGIGPTDEMIAETRREYDALIPRVPYIGGKQPFTRFLISTAQFLAMYRVLGRRGVSLEEAGELIYRICEEVMGSYPGFVLKILGGSNFSGRHIRDLRRRAEESQRRLYPGDYVYSFVEGDGEGFDYGVDYTECASVKFLEAEGAPELAPYLCLIDILYSERFDWGLRRTTTLAEGGARCDFRFKRGGETRVASSVLRKGNPRMD